MWKSIFLAGLNEMLDQACAQVLGKKPVPSLMEAFSIIRSEENRRTVMLDGNRHREFGIS